MLKKTIFSLFFVSFFFFNACGSNVDKDKFLNTYREILIARNEILDSSNANMRVLQILKNNNYTEQSFKEEFFYLAKNENGFLKIIDSLRNSITTEFKHKLDSTNKINKPKIQE
jgi:hypothetical protein